MYDLSNEICPCGCQVLCHVQVNIAHDCDKYFKKHKQQRSTCVHVIFYVYFNNIFLWFVHIYFCGFLSIIIEIYTWVKQIKFNISANMDEVTCGKVKALSLQTIFFSVLWDSFVEK